MYSSISSWVVVRELITQRDATSPATKPPHIPPHFPVVSQLAEPASASGRTSVAARLGLDHRNRKVGPVAQQVVGAFLSSAAGRAADEEDAPVGKSALLVNSVWRGVPAGGLECGHNKCAAGVGFSQHHGRSC